MASDRPAARPRVVVIGASLAGLLAAAAVSRAGHTVTILERDRLEDTPGPRTGVPQGQQPHVFLLRGLLAAEQLLPGLRSDLEAHGAVPFDTGTLGWLAEQGWAPVRPSGFEIVSLTRPLFEQVVRHRVLDLPGVQLRDTRRVNALRRDGSRGTHWQIETDSDETVVADLVIDASGRGSRLPAWLVDNGITAPRMSEVDARMGYATRMYSGAPDMPGLSGIVVQTTPGSPAGGMALPVENGRWLVLALGAGEFRPPRNVEGFEAHIDGLRDPAVSDFVRRCTPCGDVVVYRQTGNRRWHYERLRDWPDGQLAVGDAFVSFNPVFGQGITVPACEALVLRDALAAGLRSADARRLMLSLAATAALPWSIAIGQDLRLPSTNGRQTRSQLLTNAWARELSRLGIHGNARAVQVLNRIYHLMGSPRILLHPALVGAAIRARVVGYGPATPRPPALDALARG